MKKYELEVSVVIPTFNRQDFLAKAIDSVIKQKWEVVDNKYEIIVVDDGSKDNTQEVIKFFKKKCPKIINIKHKSNKGISQTLNTGFKVAKGKYICWLSDDDKWYLPKIKVQYKMMEENPEYPLSYSDYVNNDLRHNTITHSKVYQFTTRGEALKRLFKDCFINGSTIMMKREVFDEIGYMSEEEENKWNQDLEYWFRLLLHYDKILYIDKPLVQRTNHENMLSQRWCGKFNDILFPKVIDKINEKGIAL